jgi:hypothetical protein
MTKSILVSLAVLTLSTSAALAAHRSHHSHAMNPNASAAAVNPNPFAGSNAFGGAGATPVIWPGGGGVSSSDRAMYIKNLHDAGYDPKNNFNANGILKTQ